MLQPPPTDTFTSSPNNKTFKIYHNTNCISNNVIYLLECTLCNKQYVGKAETQFNIRVNNYRHRIRTTTHNLLLPVEAHFRSIGHDFKRHAKFTIIEKMVKHIPNRTTQILLQHENEWIKRLNTLLPHGFNSKLNHLTNN